MVLLVEVRHGPQVGVTHLFNFDVHFRRVDLKVLRVLVGPADSLGKVVHSYDHDIHVAGVHPWREGARGIAFLSQGPDDFGMHEVYNLTDVSYGRLKVDSTGIVTGCKWAADSTSDGINCGMSVDEFASRVRALAARLPVPPIRR